MEVDLEVESVKTGSKFRDEFVVQNRLQLSLGSRVKMIILIEFFVPIIMNTLSNVLLSS